MACISYVVANLVEVDMCNGKKSKHVIQKIVDIELHDAQKKRHTYCHWSLNAHVDFKHI